MTRQVLPAKRFVTAQRVHFLVCDLLPLILAIGLPLMLAQNLLIWQGFVLWLGMWFLVGGLGVSVGLHRHFSHRSFSAYPAVRFVMAVFGCMAAQGSVIYWVALHRMHHTYSDKVGDPHSPHSVVNGKQGKFS